MEEFIEENITQPDPQRLTKVIFWEQTIAWGGILLLILAALIAAWWVNHREN
ncbi:hypothetical protein PCC7418_1763 [Halothece sp. PCC 7418]|uniref:hypothetical protein n=1 Tax=Halothece sp. (strain PCC 7418) TaxID=65093 RepID=UPI0002A07405|nr:hypothetical protein [Halothece sp. PCC 7418]AFZ43932.1 hypothetical protein PCC7418_1763 [Halothece sp. PCC 7418]